MTLTPRDLLIRARNRLSRARQAVAAGLYQPTLDDLLMLFAIMMAVATTNPDVPGEVDAVCRKVDEFLDRVAPTSREVN